MDALNQASFAKYARRLFSGTLLSRISGMVRDISMAAIFGDHPSVAAFMVAFRFSHFLRRLLGEGALQSIFIPHYEALTLENPTKAQGFFTRITLLLALLLLLIISLIEVSCSLFSIQGETAHLFTWMFPSLFFICLYGLNISLLQCQKAFFLSSVAPFICNLIWIGAIFFLAHQEISTAMRGLTLAIVIGFIAQWLMTFLKVLPTFRHGLKEISSSPWTIPSEIKSISKASLFGLIGIMAVQLNSFLDLLFARIADLKGPIYLWYAIRLQQLPLALIGFACAYSIIPSLSRAIKARQQNEASQLHTFSINRIYQWMIPCTFATCVLGFSSVNLLFGRGHFSLNAVQETTWCLWAYALGLLPATLTVYLASTFYAHDNYKTPCLASLISVATSTCLNIFFIFIFHWSALSIAISTSISALLNYTLLKKMQPLYPIAPQGHLRWILSSLIASIGVLSLDYLSYHAFFWQAGFIAPTHWLNQALHLLKQTLTFATLFFASAYLLRPKPSPSLEA